MTKLVIWTCCILVMGGSIDLEWEGIQYESIVWVIRGWWGYNQNVDVLVALVELVYCGHMNMKLDMKFHIFGDGLL